MTSTGFWTSPTNRWPPFFTIGGSRRSPDTTRPAIHCKPLDARSPEYIITVERWTNERAAGDIMPADYTCPNSPKKT